MPYQKKIFPSELEEFAIGRKRISSDVLTMLKWDLEFLRDHMCKRMCIILEFGIVHLFHIIYITITTAATTMVIFDNN